MRKIKLWVYYLIKYNPARFVTFLICLILLSILANTDNGISKTSYSNVLWIDTTQKAVVFQDGKEVRLTNFTSSKSFKYDSKSKILDVWEPITSREAIIIILSIISCIVFIVSIFSDINDDFLDLRRVKVKVYSYFVKVEEEGGIYYYHLFGKLLYENNYLLSDLEDMDSPIYSYIKNPDFFPDFNGTVQQKRDNILDKLLTKKQ